MKLTPKQQELLGSLLPLIKDLCIQHARPRRGISATDLEGPVIDAAERLVVRFEEERGVPLFGYAWLRLRRAVIDAKGAIRKHHTREVLVGQRYLERDGEAVGDAHFADMHALLDIEEAPDADAERYVVAEAAGITMMFLMARAGDRPTILTSLGVAERGDPMLERLDAALLRLDATEHAFVRAFYAEERSLAAIAADMKVSIRTISRLHKRVKERLAQLLGRAPAKGLP